MVKELLEENGFIFDKSLIAIDYGTDFSKRIGISSENEIGINKSLKQKKELWSNKRLTGTAVIS